MLAPHDVVQGSSTLDDSRASILMHEYGRWHVHRVVVALHRVRVGTDTAHHHHVADGTQWVLWIEQLPSSKSIYFNNSFPRKVTAYANGLDALMQKAGLNTVKWTAVPMQERIDQQRALWARIEPAK